MTVAPRPASTETHSTSQSLPGTWIAAKPDSAATRSANRPGADGVRLMPSEGVPSALVVAE
ncbi:UNVERIFIED_CONTAM: hypothetical protein RKD50_007642 [Streptomyces canus]